MVKRQIYQVVCLLLLASWGMSITGCASPAPLTQQLRITNNGKMTVENFSVLFPEDEIQFGSISPGVTTSYQDVPNGVYGYAAYRFDVDGEIITQSVTDWVGEVPLGGDTFTYVITFSSSRSQWEMVKLIEVKIDE
jgi:hypothetical protein